MNKRQRTIVELKKEIRSYISLAEYNRKSTVHYREIVDCQKRLIDALETENEFLRRMCLNPVQL